MASTVWATGGCVSWYLNAAGRNPTLWPGSAPVPPGHPPRGPGEYRVIPAEAA